MTAGDLADRTGRRTTIVLGCSIYCVGVAIQCASTTYKLLIVGRFVARLGVGFVSAIIILYMAELAPRRFRGAIVSGYQFFIIIGIMFASIVTYATQKVDTSASYRIPTGIQFLWALILAIGVFLLPETPRYFVRLGQYERAAKSLARLRGQKEDSPFITFELTEIVANHEYEMQVVLQRSYIMSWTNCFKGGLSHGHSNLR